MFVGKCWLNVLLITSQYLLVIRCVFCFVICSPHGKTRFYSRTSEQLVQSQILLPGENNGWCTIPGEDNQGMFVIIWSVLEMVQQMFQNLRKDHYIFWWGVEVQFPKKKSCWAKTAEKKTRSRGAMWKIKKCFLSTRSCFTLKIEKNISCPRIFPTPPFPRQKIMVRVLLWVVDDIGG